MKTKKWMALIPLAVGLAACDDFSFLSKEAQTGELRWILDTESITKSQAEIPDTNDFILSITDAKGEVLYEGSYGDSPAYLPVMPGSYTIGVVSIPFTTPAFGRPQYGDEQVAVVQSGKSVTVKLRCTLRNAGIRLKIASDFLESFPNGVLFVKQDKVKLTYSYTEKRIAYFFPGEVSLVLYNEGKDEVLLTRTLEERQILSISISAPGSAEGSSSVQVAVDTSKNWTSERYVIGGDNDPGSGGGGNSGAEPDDAIPVGEASAHIGEKGIWVYGYIVGGDLSSAGTTVKRSGVTKETHLALAERSTINEKASCIAVELPKGSVRDALNLVAHPDLIGTRVYIKGNVVDSYFGTMGLKGCNDFWLK